MTESAKKPPLGLKPRMIHNHQRIVDILHAMLRFTTQKKTIPVEWIDELMDLENEQHKNTGLIKILTQNEADRNSY